MLAFLPDENVTAAVTHTLRERGHEVVESRQMIAPGADDREVARSELFAGHILITHDSDFRRIARDLDLTQRESSEHLHKVQLRCDYAIAAARVASAIELIEFEWERRTPGRPLRIAITKDQIQVLR